MKIINEMKLEFMGVPENEGFARVAVSAFAVQLDPTLDVLADIKTAVSEAVTNAAKASGSPACAKAYRLMSALPQAFLHAHGGALAGL